MSSFWTTYLGGEIAYVNVGGVRTRYASLGTGDPLVLLHGRGGHLETFVRNVAELSQRFRAIAFDLLGHGMTDQAPDGRYEIDRLAAHFIAFLDALSLPRAHIVGQSLGGWVATWSALQAPGRVGRLALIEPAGLRYSHFTHTSAAPSGTTLLSFTSGVLPIAARMLGFKRMWVSFSSGPFERGLERRDQKSHNRPPPSRRHRVALDLCMSAASRRTKPARSA